MIVRQTRSEVTRRKIIDAAVELFNDVGYTNTGIGDVIERAGMTKGALYHHFDSKEALAVAVITEGSEILLKTFQGISRSAAPALESMMHGSWSLWNSPTPTSWRAWGRYFCGFSRNSARPAPSTTASGSRRWGRRHGERRPREICAPVSTPKRRANSSSARCSEPS